MGAPVGVDLVPGGTSTGANTSPVTWRGGRAALCIIAASFPTTCNLQMLGPDELTWVNVNASTISANSLTAYDLPPGQYRMNLSGGTTTTLFAKLVSVPYV